MASMPCTSWSSACSPSSALTPSSRASRRRATASASLLRSTLAASRGGGGGGGATDCECECECGRSLGSLLDSAASSSTSSVAWPSHALRGPAP
eukprot:scaffold122242_cov48-Phaeocystis_antarctica.AAC.1